MSQFLRIAGAAAMQGARRTRTALPLDALSPELLFDERGQVLGTGVSSWANQGTAGGVATQGVDANQPLQTTVNGYLVPSFDGTNDSLTTSLAASAFVTATEYEGFAVVRLNALSASVPQAPTSWYSDPSIFQCASNASLGLSMCRYGVFAGKGSSPWDRSAFVPVYNDTRVHVVAFRLQGGVLTISADMGPERSRAVTGTLTPLTGLLNLGVNFGGAAPAAVTLCTLMLKKVAVTPTQRMQARLGLCQKWGVFTGKTRDVLWAGDSITLNAGGAQWRQRVQTVNAAQLGYRTTGSVRGTGAAFPQNMVSAAGGYTISGLTGMFATAGFGLGDYTFADIVAILIGTNNLGGTDDCAALLPKYLALLTDVKNRLPNALIVAQKILHRTDFPVAEARVLEWDADYHVPMVTTAQGMGINVISDDTLETCPGVVMPDGLHPDAASGTPMGNAIAPVALSWIAAVP